MESVKRALYYIGLPFLMLMGVIFYLVQQMNGLKDQLQGKKRDAALGELANALKEASHESQDAETDYRAAADAYKREHGDGG